MFDNVPILELASKIKLGGKLFGDKGYLCKKEMLNKLKNENNIELITKTRKNMKNKKENNLPYHDRLLLSKRGVVKIVIGQIKEQTNIVTSKIRNIFNYLTNILTSLVSYILKDNKPKLNFKLIEKEKLVVA